MALRSPAPGSPVRGRRPRRACLAVLAACAVIMGAAAGCTSQPAPGQPAAQTVTVLDPWTGTEQAYFLDILHKFTSETHIDVTATGTSTLDQVLQTARQNSALPDAVVLPRPGDLRSYAGLGLVPINAILRGAGGRYGSEWQALTQAAAPGGVPRQYAVVLKISVKSLIWYSPQQLQDLLPGGQGPKSWAGLNQLSGELAGRGTPWCLGMGAGSSTGSAGTDWIEDIVLHEFGPSVYEKWANGALPWTSPQIAQAWQQFGDLVRTQPGGTASALLNNASDMGEAMFAGKGGQPACYLDHTSYIGFYQYFPGHPQPGRGFGFFPFPSMGAPGGQAWEVGADLVGLFHETPQSSALIRFLASDTGQAVWPSEPGSGVFSADQNLWPGGPHALNYGNTVNKAIAGVLASGDTLCFDASDLMPQEMSDAFNQAVVEFLGDPQRYQASPSAAGPLLKQLDQVRHAVYGSAPTTYQCS